MTDKVVLREENPWDSEAGPDIIFDATHVREITATTLVDEHQSKGSIMRELAKGAEDLGDGFMIQDEPVLIQRGPDGGIVRITPLSEIVGVHFEGTVLKKDPDLKTSREIEADARVAEEREELVVIPRAQREKLRHILTTRLWNHYMTEASLRNRAKWNPFRDGLPEAPDGAPEFLQPSAEMPLIPATPHQVYEYLLKHVAQRAKVIDTKRFGGGTLQDLALRID